ncbi:MAG: Uma2 family endonuclease, partial [Thiobacillaceae bacterium]|nr:Uma2 family endonuclease [Thiobacillaceae bacterium]
PLPHPPRYTVADYLSWSDERRYELIDGEAWLMAPAPMLQHQSITLALGAQLLAQLDDRVKSGVDCPCRVFVAPVDVVLGADTVVQPDVVMVCDPQRLANGRYIDGPPELVIEVTSPATARRDRLTKRDLYERVGVAVYCIVEPEAGTVECYRLEGGRYGKPEVYAAGDRLTLPYCDGLALDLTALFGPPPPVRPGPAL